MIIMTVCGTIVLIILPFGALLSAHTNMGERGDLHLLDQDVLHAGLSALTTEGQEISDIIRLKILKDAGPGCQLEWLQSS